MEAGQVADPTSYVEDVVAKLYELAKDETDVVQILDCFALDQISHEAAMDASETGHGLTGLPDRGDRAPRPDRAE